MKRVLGIDSETVNDATGRARCVLVATSDGTHLARPRGITTEQALRYITRRKGELWTFFGDYDINFWLRDLPPSRLDRLRQRGWATWGRWRIHHVPRRLFEVWDLLSGHYARVYDAFPFVQTSFVRWLESWNLCDRRTLEHVSAMKSRRSEFSHVSASKILRYTQDEVRLIASGVEVVKDRIRAAGIRPSQWLGPGAVAAAVLRKRKVRDYMPERPHPWADRAYFGGRIETAAVGVLRGPLYYYDLTSAYPAAARTLPCFRHGRWKRERGVLPDVGLAFVRWAPRRGVRPVWGPFPVRPKPGAPLRYYARGSGWYWADEVRPWLDSFDYRLEIGLVWRWSPACTCRPLEWVSDLFEERRRLKLAGDPAEYALKLVLNSVYGKFAQSVGSASFRCVEWAGMITARTRGRIARVLVRYGPAVKLVATDGVLLDRRVRIPRRPGLGSWVQEGTYQWADLWQPGFYILSDGKVRTRGYSKVEVDPEELRRAWNRDGFAARVPIRKEYVTGYRLSAARGNWEDFCRWTRLETELSLNPLPRRFLGEKIRGENAFRTYAPHSWEAEKALGVPLLTRDGIGELEEDGCPEGFARD